jgi:hypothetical protein
MQRRHVTGFLRTDPEQLPDFAHIAVIADDNMESGISLREMRREFDRIKDRPNPPLAIYGAPLLLIRGQTGLKHSREQTYTGRRKSKLPLAAPLSNIPESSELYRKILDRLKRMGDHDLPTTEPEEDHSEEGKDLSP